MKRIEKNSFDKGNKKCKLDLKVLYCEDLSKTANTMMNSLEKRFREVILANDGIDGLAKYQSASPDLVITDIRMPNLDGLEMARRIRKDDKKVKIIIISAHTDIDYFLHAIDYGVNAFVTKPVDFKLFDEHINSIYDDICLQKKVKEEEQKRLQMQREHQKLYHEIKQDLTLASSVQEYLLPEWLHLSDKVIFSSAYSPSLDVGGDLFGYYPIDKDRYVFYLGDVSGHGLKSAMLMMAAYSTINMLIEQEKDNLIPCRIVNKLNKILSTRLFAKNNYMTLILGTLDTVSNEVRYIRAGHPELIIFDHSQNRARLLVNSKGTIPVGWMDNYNVTEEDEEVFFLKDDETVYLYSDGLFECNRPDGERLGQDSLVQQMNSKIPQTQALTSSLEFMQYIRELGYDIRQDDFTMVSFFKPSYSTIPDLKQYFQANIPDDTDMVQIQCSDFLFEMTADMQFALAVENDFNELFYSGSLQWQSSFISGFMLLLAYQNGYIEVKFWFRSILHQMELGREIDACELPNEININHKLNQLSIKKNNYLVKVYFKYLGDIVQVTCLLNPLANTKKGSN